MAITISFDRPQMRSRSKGNSLLSFFDDFVVIDTETTGYEPRYDEMIEFAAIRVRNGVPTETMQTLIKPEEPIDDFIVSLTGITNEMLADSPSIAAVMPQIMSFIGNDIIVGHNVNFDINFLYDANEALTGQGIKNDYIDTLRLSRRLLPELPHHRLEDVAKYLKIPQTTAHRSLADCETTLSVFVKLKEVALERYGTLDKFYDSVTPKAWQGKRIGHLTTNKTEFDESHPLYGKVCVFTGTLERMTRADAAQIVVDLGGSCGTGVTRDTNFLILGTNDYCKSIKDGKSSKQKKAEDYKLKGFDIEIIPESVFYEMIEQ